MQPSTALVGTARRVTGREHGHSIHSRRFRYLCKATVPGLANVRDDGTAVVVAQLRDVSEEMAPRVGPHGTVDDCLEYGTSTLM